MNHKNADKIIANYKPHKGFFDLSEKPKSLSKIEYEKVLDLQNLITHENDRRDYIKKHNPHSWQQLQEYAAQLQQIIFRHWGDKVFDEVSP
jgi:hypothetical protein